MKDKINEENKVCCHCCEIKDCDGAIKFILKKKYNNFREKHTLIQKCICNDAETKHLKISALRSEAKSQINSTAISIGSATVGMSCVAIVIAITSVIATFSAEHITTDTLKLIMIVLTIFVAISALLGIFNIVYLIFRRNLDKGNYEIIEICNMLEKHNDDEG